MSVKELDFNKKEDKKILKDKLKKIQNSNHPLKDLQIDILYANLLLDLLSESYDFDDSFMKYKRVFEELNEKISEEIDEENEEDSNEHFNVKNPRMKYKRKVEGLKEKRKRKRVVLEMRRTKSSKFK